MPQNYVTDPITDKEIAFAHLVLSGIMTDRRAAEAVGLSPGTAAYTKSEPRVRAYMLEHLADEQQRLVEQDTEERCRLALSRDRILARLWQIADVGPEMTRNGMSAQVKALAMIIAIEGLIPDRRAVSVQNKLASSANPPFYVSEWMRAQQNGESVNPQLPQEEAAPEPQSSLSPDSATTEELSSSRPVVEGPEVQAPLNALQTPPSQTVSSTPRVPMADNVAPDTRRPFSIDRNRFGGRR
jgi:hypothetical protein